MIIPTRRGALAMLAASLPTMSPAQDVPPIQRLPGFDGAGMAVRVLGEGRPVLMLHGFLSDGRSWFATGLAQRLAADGGRVIAPDFRAHGQSAAPVDPSAYPDDVLAQDQEALLKALGIESYDLVGYSMGALVAVRMLARGARPGRVVLGGMGDARVMGETARDAFFRDAVANGERAADPVAARPLQARMASQGLQPRAILGVLQSLGRTPAPALSRLRVPALVVSGDQDQENGSAEGLAASLPNARALRVPGTHGSAPAAPAFQAAVTTFLQEA